MPVPPELLGRFGWSRLVWTRAVYPHEFRELLGELRGEDCVHTWAETADAASIDGDPVTAVLAQEAVRRPTLVVSYLGIRADGSFELVAVGSVAERISRTFPFEGFPVIARCYVRQRFRGAGLYRYLLAQRLQLCQRLCGSQLKAIHLGSVNPCVLHAAASGAVGERFVRVGEENLCTGDQWHRVAALLLFVPAFARSVREALDQWFVQCGPQTRGADWAVTLRRQFHELVTVGLEPGGYDTLLEHIDQVEQCTGRQLADGCQPVRELLALFQAIPLVRERLRP